MKTYIVNHCIGNTVTGCTKVKTTSKERAERLAKKNFVRTWFVGPKAEAEQRAERMNFKVWE